MLRLLLILTTLFSTHIFAGSPFFRAAPAFPSTRTMEVLCENALGEANLPPLVCDAINQTLSHRQQFKPRSMLSASTFLRQHLACNAPGAIWHQIPVLKRYLNWYTLNHMQTTDCDLKKGFSRVEHIDEATIACFAKGSWKISKKGAACPWDVREFPNVFFASGQLKDANDVGVNYDWVNSQDGTTPRFVTFNMQGTLVNDSIILTRKGNGAIALHISGNNHENPYTILNKWRILEGFPFSCEPREREIAEMLQKMPITKMTTVTPLNDQQSKFFGES